MREVEVKFPVGDDEWISTVFEAMLDALEEHGCGGGHGSLRTGAFTIVFDD